MACVQLNEIPGNQLELVGCISARFLGHFSTIMISNFLRRVELRPLAGFLRQRISIQLNSIFQ